MSITSNEKLSEKQQVLNHLVKHREIDLSSPPAKAIPFLDIIRLAAIAADSARINVVISGTPKETLNGLFTYQKSIQDICDKGNISLALDFLSGTITLHT